MKPDETPEEAELRRTLRIATIEVFLAIVLILALVFIFAK